MAGGPETSAESARGTGVEHEKWSVRNSSVGARFFLLFLIKFDDRANNESQNELACVKGKTKTRGEV